jgi:hypothetical protein
MRRRGRRLYYERWFPPARTGWFLPSRRMMDRLIELCKMSLATTRTTRKDEDVRAGTTAGMGSRPGGLGAPDWVLPAPARLRRAGFFVLGRSAPVGNVSVTRKGAAGRSAIRSSPLGRTSAYFGFALVLL